MIDLSLNEHVLPLRISGFEMGEYAGELPRKFISFHCLDNESNEQKKCITEKTENFPMLSQEGESGGESPEKRLIELEVMPVGEIQQGSTDVPNVVENVQEVSHDESQIIVSQLLGGSLEVLDDSELRQLIENAPVQSETELSEERSCAIVGGMDVGQITESVTFLDDVVDVGSGNRTSTPAKDVVLASYKRKVEGVGTEGEVVLRQKVVAFEIGDGSDGESAAFQSESARANACREVVSQQ